MDKEAQASLMGFVGNTRPQVSSAGTVFLLLFLELVFLASFFLPLFM